MRVSPAARSCEKISSTNGMIVFKIWIVRLCFEELWIFSCEPPTDRATLGSSAANNPPNSIRHDASQTPDIFAAPPLRGTHPCVPSPSNSSPRFAQCHSQWIRPQNSTFPGPPKVSLQVQDHPPSSANPGGRAPASSYGYAHPSCFPPMAPTPALRSRFRDTATTPSYGTSAARSPTHTCCTRQMSEPALLPAFPQCGWPDAHPTAPWPPKSRKHFSSCGMRRAHSRSRSNTCDRPAPPPDPSCENRPCGSGCPCKRRSNCAPHILPPTPSPAIQTD